MDPVLIMDDIIEKLHLLDYLKTFCVPKKFKPLSRTYFAIKADNENKVLKIKYFIELCYWLMSLSYK